MFSKLFNKLNTENPKFFKEKIKTTSRFDPRSQIALKIILGQYKELKNEKIEEDLFYQRAVMIFGITVSFVMTISFLGTIILSN